MEPVLLKFHEPSVEQVYKQYKVLGLTGDGVGYVFPLLSFIFRSLVMLRVCNGDGLEWGQTAALMLFCALPLVRILVLKKASAAWLMRHMACMQFCEGLLQGPLTVVLITASQNNMAKQSNGIVDTVLASGVLIQCSNMAWLCLSFKSYLMVNTWTAGCYVHFVMPHYCFILERVVSDRFLQRIMASLDQVYNGPLVGIDGNCIPSYSSPCYKLTFFWYLLTFGAISPILVWWFERKFRLSFWRNLNDLGEVAGCTDIEKCLKVGNLFPGMILFVPIAWQIALLVY